MFDWVKVPWYGYVRVRNCCKDFPLLIDLYWDLALIDVCNDQHDLWGEKKACGCCKVCLEFIPSMEHLFTATGTRDCPL